jgi:hypothetical protein
MPRKKVAYAAAVTTVRATRKKNREKTGITEPAPTKNNTDGGVFTPIVTVQIIMAILRE